MKTNELQFYACHCYYIICLYKSFVLLEWTEDLLENCSIVMKEDLSSCPFSFLSWKCFKNSTQIDIDHAYMPENCRNFKYKSLHEKFASFCYPIIFRKPSRWMIQDLNSQLKLFPEPFLKWFCIPPGRWDKY